MHLHIQIQYEFSLNTDGECFVVQCVERVMEDEVTVMSCSALLAPFSDGIFEE